MSVGTRLWLVRHGENGVERSGRGGIPAVNWMLPLTELGRERAAVLGKYLAGTNFAAVLRSPMLRAKETCEIARILATWPWWTHGLKEWDYGVYEGRL